MSSELMGIQQNMSFVTEGYTNLGDTLKNRMEQLSDVLQEVKETQKETEEMMTWLKDMKNTAASWNAAAAEKDSVKTQLEQQKVKMSFNWTNKPLNKNNSHLLAFERDGGYLALIHFLTCADI